MDISLLFDKPDLSKKALLVIEPLAPLSMVNSMPGSYYKTEHVPTKQMLCGLLENMLGFHFSHEHRTAIRKKLKQHFKKLKLDFPEDESLVGFLPVTHHLFEIEPPIVLPQMIFFEDYWTQHLIGGDERHLKGATNYDWRLEEDINRIKEIENSGEQTRARNNLFSEQRSHFPMYYRSPQRREFIVAEGTYEFILRIQDALMIHLVQAIGANNSGYLGTSEGWVHLSLEEMK
jgi:CRISPR-associated protein Cas5